MIPHAQAIVVGAVMLLVVLPVQADKFTIANVYANSEQAEPGNMNPVANVKDGDLATRWAAGGGSFPQWILLDLGAVKEIDSTRAAFYMSAGRTYTYSISISPDDITYTVVVPDKQSSTAQFTTDAIGSSARYIMIVISAVSNGTGWASMYEAEVYGSDLSAIAHPAARSAARDDRVGAVVRFIDNRTLLIGGRGGPYADGGVYSLDGRRMVCVQGVRQRAVTFSGSIHSGIFYVFGTVGSRQVRQSIMIP